MNKRVLSDFFSIIFVIIVIIAFVCLIAKSCDAPSSYEPHDGTYFQRKEINDRNMEPRVQQNGNTNTNDEYYYEKVRCHKCYGLGSIPDFSDHNNLHSDKCPVCNGTGYIMEKKYYESSK